MQSFLWKFSPRCRCSSRQHLSPDSRIHPLTYKRGNMKNMSKVKTCSPSNDQVVPVSIQGNPIALIVDVPAQWIRSNANALKNDQIVLPTTPGIKASWLPKSVTPNLLVGRSINLKKSSLFNNNFLFGLFWQGIQNDSEIGA